MQKKILIVDDEEHILELLKYNLEANNYSVVESETGTDALFQLEISKNIDAVILDWMLPDIDGIEVLRRIRSNPIYKKLPVLMLTAKNEEFDTVLGLEMGADDYLGKPFSMRELLARLKSILRRREDIESIQAEKKEEKLVFDNIVINETFRTVSKDNDILDMPLKEYELLILFAKNPGRVFSREDLLEKIWGYDFLGETRTVDVHIRNLRKKIEEDDANPNLIKTVRGIGYKFREGKS
jgi:two-component system alkaline phosphatase synthesis response regulator PhoP